MHHLSHHPIKWLEHEIGIKMTAPINAAISFDKSIYQAGDTVTATITWDSGEAVQTTTVTLTVNISNQNDEFTNIEATFEVSTEPITDTFTVKATDDGNRSWNVSMGSDGVSATATTIA